MRPRQPLLALLAGLSLFACKPQSGSASAEPSDTIAVSNTSILERIPDAPMTTAYRGKRRVTFRYEVEGHTQTLAYDEEVFSDGTGRFQVHTTNLQQPPLSGQALEIFLMRQQAYDSFFYLHRDFRIRSLPLFLQNYTLRQSPTSGHIAGRDTIVFSIRPRGDGSSYRAEVDVETGLVLRWKEFDSRQLLVAEVEFTEFTLDPDLTGVELHGPSLLTTPLDLQGDLVAQMGFQVPRPSYVPDSYRLMKAEKVTAAGSSWARITYGNGAEQIFYLFQDPSVGTLPNSSVHAPAADSVTLSQIGPWTAASGQISGRRYMVMGKVSDTTLLDMIQSSL